MRTVFLHIFNMFILIKMFNMAGTYEPYWAYIIVFMLMSTGIAFIKEKYFYETLERERLKSLFLGRLFKCLNLCFFLCDSQRPCQVPFEFGLHRLAVGFVILVQIYSFHILLAISAKLKK